MNGKFKIVEVDEIPSRWKNPIRNHRHCPYKGLSWRKSKFGNLTRRKCKRCGYCEYYPTKLEMPTKLEKLLLQ